MERYNKAQSNYDTARETAKRTKLDYKSGKVSKSAYKSSKKNVRTAKKELDKSYDRLKTDKMADEGKKLYQRGKTITRNTKMTEMTETGIVVGATVANKVLSQWRDQRTANIASATIAVGGTFVNAVLSVKTSSENKKLRAYYAH